MKTIILFFLKEYREKNPAVERKPAPDPKKAAAQPAPGSSPDKKAAEETTDKSKKSSDKPVELTDAQLIETNDDKLTPELKEKKGKLATAKAAADKKAAEEAEEAEAFKPSNIQKRIDELVGEIKSLKNDKDQDKELIKKLEVDLTSLKAGVDKPGNEQALTQKLNALEGTRIKERTEAGKSLPKPERLEMSKEDLEDWLVEDPVAAQEWLSDRAVRRYEERKADSQKELANSQAENIIARQKASRLKVEAKHPDLNFDARKRALMAEGKTAGEAMAVILEENPKVKIIMEVLKERGNDFVLDPEGPEKLMIEMEKRLTAKPADNTSETDKDKEAKIREEAAEAERQRQANIDSGITSNNGGKPVVKKSEQYQKRLEVFKRAGKSQEDLDRTLARRQTHGLE